MELPEAIWAKDREGLGTGILESGQMVPSDNIASMKVGQVRALLKNIGIDLNKTIGVSRGFCLLSAGDLDHATDSRYNVPRLMYLDQYTKISQHIVTNTTNSYLGFR